MTTPLHAALARLVTTSGPAAALPLLQQTERLEPSLMQAQQLARARELWDHSRRTAPYYAGLPAPRERAVTLEEWRALPILGRREVLDERERLRSSAPPPGHGPAREARSSGSTGRPVSVTVDRVAAALSHALALRSHFWHRRDLTLKGAGIRALPSGAQAPMGLSAQRWAAHRDAGPLVLLDVHTTLDAQLDWLLREDPGYLATYPSNAAGLVARAEARGLRLPSLRELGTFGEVVPDGLPERCRRVLGVPLIDSYSAVELGHIALRCPEGAGYHVQSENVLVEILRDDHGACDPGETGRVVVTALHSFVMPLIRYDLGDLATVGEPCACGRGLGTLTRVAGRSRNLLRLPDGQWLWPRYGSNVLGLRFPLLQFRLRQVGRVDLVLDYVPARPLGGEDRAALAAFVLEHLGEPFRLTLEELAEVPREASGKFEDFVCELGDPRADGDPTPAQLAE
ncbi:MAG: phenylacetate--CoA ligase family protein [Polyangiaceae bacterium]|nr:phenylacetate--CoA ligase family protein [Polyangiaceae bacterium]